MTEPPSRSQEDRFAGVRAASEALAAPLSPEDCAAQSMPDASPVKWHLAHTSWFFETFVLAREVAGHVPFHPDFRFLFNSYYNAVGPQFSRPERGLLTRPDLETVLDYRQHVTDGVRALFARPGGLSPETAEVVEIGLHHEQQHQELILSDVLHLFSRNPLHPAYREGGGPRPDAKPTPLTWHPHPGGLVELGHTGGGFAFDNEGPRHAFHLGPFELGSRLVTNAEYCDFMEEGGYRLPELWLSDAWATVQREGWQAPLYWEQRDGAWHQLGLDGLREVHPDEPVCHVSFYEADAYARWAGARLPSEQEWEVVAATAPVRGNFVESSVLAPAGAFQAEGLPAQLFGDCWEWTRSPYGAYPGYAPPAGALGEYNGKFMANQIVLRGGSCATPGDHVRPTYRNFFFPEARWQWSGIRLARDVW